MNIRRKRTHSIRIASVLTTLLLPLVVGLAPARADLITFFDFNNGAALVNSSRGRTSTITNNFQPDSLTFTFTGTDVNADPDDAGPQPASAAGSALELFNTNANGTISNQGRFIQFGVDTTGFQNLIVNFATEDPSPSGNGFSNNIF